MKIVLAGAFGNLGSAILKRLVEEGHEVVAAGRTERPVAGTDKCIGKGFEAAWAHFRPPKPRVSLSIDDRTHANSGHVSSES